MRASLPHRRRDRRPRRRRSRPPRPPPRPALPRPPAPVADWTQGWSGQATLYAWLPVINGSQEGPDGSPIVDLDTSDVLSALDMAFMGSAQFQKDKFGILLDAVYADLGTDGTWVQNRVKHRDRHQARLLHRRRSPTGSTTTPRASSTSTAAPATSTPPSTSRSAPPTSAQASFSKSLNWTDAIIGVRGG